MSDCGCDSGGGDYGGGDSGGCDYGGGDSGGCDYGGGDSGGCDYGGRDSGSCDYGGGDSGGGNDCCNDTQSATSNRNSFTEPAVVDVFLDDTYNVNPYNTTIQDDSYVPVHTYTKYTTHRTYNTRIRNRTYYNTSSSGGCDGDDTVTNFVVGIISVFLIFIVLIAMMKYNTHR